LFSSLLNLHKYLSKLRKFFNYVKKNNIAKNIIKALYF